MCGIHLREFMNVFLNLIHCRSSFLSSLPMSCSSADATTWPLVHALAALSIGRDTGNLLQLRSLDEKLHLACAARNRVAPLISHLADFSVSPSTVEDETWNWIRAEAIAQSRQYEFCKSLAQMPASIEKETIFVVYACLEHPEEEPAFPVQVVGVTIAPVLASVVIYLMH